MHTTVEYCDPSANFDLVRSTLLSYLPLRNLHWKSSTRPTRSISSLHVDLIPDVATSFVSETAGINDGEDISKLHASSEVPLKKGRRHQIPGLRQTPYLKLFFFQCDDVDTYRATARQRLRDWVSNQGPPSQSTIAVNKQENHDAFEWLIIHVTGPGTETSSLGSVVKGDAEVVKKSNSSRWTSRGTKTVIEKLRVDFNGSSKHAVDRIAQVYLSNGAEVSEELNHGSQESGKGWEDLVTKMKALILASFDLRVQQYEEDIKEKELQRTMPGWNFNTFFVLKEGLARGFESVGLIEDALAGYHELAAGLNAVVDDQLIGEVPEQQTTHFQDSTEELKQVLDQIIRTAQPQTDGDRFFPLNSTDIGSWLLDTDRKPFRHLILENNISVFDFQCYVFARRVALLLRLALTTPTDAKSGEAGRENLLLLVDICQLASTFIASSAWTLRRDLNASFQQLFRTTSLEARSAQGPFCEQIVSNLVASWTFSACHRILDVTGSQSLAPHLDGPFRQARRSAPKKRNGQNGSLDHDETKYLPMHFPRRTSSLSFQSPVDPTGPSQRFPVHETSSDFPPQSAHPIHTGTHELSGERGNMFFIARRTLSSLVARLEGWRAGFDAGSDNRSDNEDNMQDIDLNGNPEESLDDSGIFSRKIVQATGAGVNNRWLKAALRDRDVFHALYEDLTVSALAHYIVAGRVKMAGSMAADLAFLFFNLKDYSMAASNFKLLTSSYDDKRWLKLETTMLDQWAGCLYEMGDTREHISIALRAVASASTWLHVPVMSKWSLKDLIRGSESMTEQITLPLEHFFADIGLGRYIRHFDGHDGFALHSCLRSLVPESFHVKSLHVYLIGIGENRATTLSLICEKNVLLNPGPNEVAVTSTTMIPGLYMLHKISLRTGNLHFTYETSSAADTLDLPGSQVTPDLQDTVDPAKRILVWQHSQSLSVDMFHSDKIHLSEDRHVDLKIASGWNCVESFNINIRAASAGLRLHLAKAKIRDDLSLKMSISHDGQIECSGLANFEQIIIAIPYSLETELSNITLRTEVTYNTNSGHFVYVLKECVPINLPLAINVRDTFQFDRLVSRYTIGSATESPVRIQHVQIASNDDFDLTTSPCFSMGADIVPQQPLAYIVHVRRTHESGDNVLHAQPKRRLYLQIQYCCLKRQIILEISAGLEKMLAACRLQSYSRLLLQHLGRRLRTDLVSKDLEMFMIFREAHLRPFNEYRWNDVLCDLAPDISTEVRRRLLEWHQESQSVAINGQTDLLSAQQLTVPVDIPAMNVVHRATLRLLHAPMPFHAAEVTEAQGCPIPAEVGIEHTRQWSDGKDDEALDFCYELQDNQDNWLIGGQCSARFWAKEGERHTFAVLLLPQRTGHLLLPTIHVRPVSSSQDGAGDGSHVAPTKRTVTCEIEYVNQAETILIIPNVSSTTVSLDSSSAWLVESQGRNGLG